MGSSERWLLRVIYGCNDCEWPPGAGEGNNGVGVAAQHAQRTGHDVWAEATYHHRWNDPQPRGSEP